MADAPEAPSEGGVGGAFQRKLGPLKVWQWGAIVIGGVVGIVIVRRLMGKGGPAVDTTGTGVGTTGNGGPGLPTSGGDFTSTLQSLSDSFTKGQQSLADALTASNAAQADKNKSLADAIAKASGNQLERMPNVSNNNPGGTISGSGVLQSSGMTEQAIREYLTATGYSAQEAAAYAGSHVGTQSIQNFNDVNNYLHGQGFNR